MTSSSFFFGEWLVDPQTSSLARGRQRQQLEPRAIDVLAVLCAHPGEVCSSDHLLRRCWPGLVVGENQVHKAIAQLRRVLGERIGGTVYIETIRKRGYRTVAPVRLAAGGTSAAAPRSWTDGSPFVGLESFDARHAPVFFGRDAAIGLLHQAVLMQVRKARAQILVLGPSGSGKTSLVQAGLIPLLRRTGSAPRVLGATTLDMGGLADEPPLVALAAALIDLEIDGRPALRDYSAVSLASDLHDASEFVIAQLRRSLGPPGEHAVLFIDRLEALLAEASFADDQRQAFLRTVDALARSGAVIVLMACRNDFYPQISCCDLLMQGKATGAHFDLPLPTRAEIALMIRSPAQAAGLRFGVEPFTQARLDDLLCEAAAGSPDALPLLQYALHELYLQRHGSGELTITAYRSLGGLEGAIGRRAEQTLAALAEPVQRSLPRVLSMLVTLDDGDKAVGSRRVLWRALGDEAARELVRTLVEQRLFVTLVVDDEPVFGVAHEALLRQWPRVTDWLAQHRNALRIRHRLVEQARQWRQEGMRADRLLPQGKPLNEAIELIAGEQVPLPDPVRALIAASAGKARRSRRIRFTAAAMFAGLALLAMLLGVQARYAKHQAELRRQEAEDLMGFMVGEFSQKLRPLGRLDLLDQVNTKAMAYLEAGAGTNESPAARLHAAQTLQTIAEVARARNDPALALKALQRARELLRLNLAQAPDDLALLKNLGGVAFWLGQIDLDHGRLAPSKASFDEYAALSERARRLAPDDVDVTMEAAYAHYNLGEWHLMQRDATHALDEYTSALAIQDAVLQVRPDDRGLRAERSKCLGRIAEADRMLGRLGATVVRLQQQSAELQALIDAAPSEGRWYALQASSQYKQAEVMIAGSRLGEAQKALASAHQAITHALATNASNQLWQRERLVYAFKQAVVDGFQGYAKRSDVALRDVDAQLSEMLRKDSGNAYTSRALAAVKTRRGVLLTQQGDTAAAQRELEQALALLAAITTGEPSSLTDRIRIAGVLINLAGASNARPAQARQYCEAALMQLQGIASGSDYEALSLWVRTQICLGEVAKTDRQREFLAQIGYRDPDYITALQRQQEPPHVH